MKVLAIFAHPDDEAFGPAGTLALLSKQNEVNLVCVTDGANGKKSIEDRRTLREIRKNELLLSAKVLGIKNVHFLQYKDGNLCNSIYHQLVEKLEQVISDIKPDTLLTFEHRGFLGHIDHVTVSFVSSYIYERNRNINTIMYYCSTEEHSKMHKPYFIYIPPGYKKTDISETYDISPVWDQKIESMKQHRSQAHDYERYVSILNQLPKEEHFLVYSKKTGL